MGLQSAALALLSSLSATVYYSWSSVESVLSAVAEVADHCAKLHKLVPPEGRDCQSYVAFGYTLGATAICSVVLGGLLVWLLGPRRINTVVVEVPAAAVPPPPCAVCAERSRARAYQDLPPPPPRRRDIGLGHLSVDARQYSGESDVYRPWP